MIGKCYKCETEKELASNTLCVECMNKTEPIIKEFKYKSVVLCTRCSSYSYFKEWHREKKDDHDLILETIKKGLKINPQYILKDIKVDFKENEKESTEKKRFFTVNVNLTLNMEHEFSYAFKTKFHITNYLCQNCLKMNNNYFEGVLQIRGKDNEKYDEVEEYILNLVKKKKDVSIHKIVKDTNGLDIYVTNKRVLNDIGQKAHEEFGGTLEMNSKLFSWNKQTSKDIFRLNVLIRLPDFEKFDYIEINNTKVLVKKIRGKMITGLNVKSMKEQTFDFNNNPFEIISKRKDMSIKTTISKSFPKIEVLSENYESVPIIDISGKDPEKMKIGHNVVILNIEGKYFLIK